MIIALAIRLLLTLAFHAVRMFGVWVVNLFVDAFIDMLDEWVTKWIDSKQQIVVVSQ